jgi:hypothetical protein
MAHIQRNPVVKTALLELSKDDVDILIQFTEDRLEGLMPSASLTYARYAGLLAYLKSPHDFKVGS